MKNFVLGLTSIGTPLFVFVLVCGGVLFCHLKVKLKRELQGKFKICILICNCISASHDIRNYTYPNFFALAFTDVLDFLQIKLQTNLPQWPFSYLFVL
jgi:hypothetical protein